MSHWEPAVGASDEWYTPSYIFSAMQDTFDLDVAAPAGGGPHVPAMEYMSDKSLNRKWYGFIWMNPPFGGRNGLSPWLDKFFCHGNGIALTPDRTSAPWWQRAAEKSDAVLFIAPKVKFERADGSLGKSPGTGTTLFASGGRAVSCLVRASPHLGTLMQIKRSH